MTQPEARVQLVVEYADHQTRYYPANPGWRIDAASRCIVIGRDLPRTYVPLDGVVAWHVERVRATRPAATPAASCVTAACRTGHCGSCDLGSIHHPCQHHCHVDPVEEPA